MDLSNTSDHFKTKINMLHLSQKPQVSSKAQNQDLKYMDILFVFDIKIKSKNLEYGCIKDQWPYPNQDPDA